MDVPTLATTRLDHIRANLAAVRAHVGNRKVLAAVKADAYGHGAVEVARSLQANQSVDQFGVATVGEGIELRRAGITLPILKLSVARGPEAADAVAHDLELVVVDEPSLQEASAAGLAAGRRAGLHLKVDTGMRRIGCEPADAVRLALLADELPGVRLVGVMSHLPISDNPAGEEFTRGQIARFAAVAADVEAARGPVLKHLANSGGVLAHPDSWFDLVRPGIMIYGSYPDPECPRTVPLLPGLEWVSRVTFTKPVSAGETVGYGRTWTASRDTWIGTVSVGYGDGYSRALSNRGRMLAGGRSYPIAGRVSMDQTMIDLGPEPLVSVGDEVVLIGSSGEEQITPSELAGLTGTIPYEITCAVGRRVARAYAR
ncbi:MAG: alanine racemase [Propionicimonas sp.]|nr:alanine racemase [Propionicimonas sp.]